MGIREVLCKTDFYFLWLKQGVGDVKLFLCVFKRRLLDMFTQEWTADIRDKERYVTYRCFKKLFEAERYLSDIDILCFRVALTQLRVGVLPINNNMYRYSDFPTNRNCVFCLRRSLDFWSRRVLSRYMTCYNGKIQNVVLLLSKFTFHAMNRRKLYI